MVSIRAKGGEPNREAAARVKALMIRSGYRQAVAFVNQEKALGGP